MTSILILWALLLANATHGGPAPKTTGGPVLSGSEIPCIVQQGCDTGG